MPFRWIHAPRQAFTISPYHQQLEGHLKQVMGRWAVLIQADMQANAPWQDRTGLARQSLWATLDTSQGGFLSLRAGQGVSYGLLLELGQGGRWAIVLPTLTQAYQPLWEELTR